MTLYRYPDKAQFNKVIPKSALYQQGGATRKMQQRFVDCVEQVVWAYKLSPETINLSATKTVKEIQIFRIDCRIDCRVQAFDESILAFIDKAIPSPILYELYFDNQVKTIATYKRQSHADKTKVVIGHYYQSDWQAVTAPRADLPIVLSLGDLYEYVIAELLPLPDNINTNTSTISLEDKMATAQQFTALNKTIERLEKQLKREKQFNRKVDINLQLQKAQKARQALMENR